MGDTRTLVHTQGEKRVVMDFSTFIEEGGLISTCRGVVVAEDLRRLLRGAAATAPN